MPAPLHPRPPNPSFASQKEGKSSGPNHARVHVSQEDEDEIADIHRTLTEKDHRSSEPHNSLDEFLDEKYQDGKKPLNIGVCFQSVSTWAQGNGHEDVKTLGAALWRTLTFQDVYEWTIKPWTNKTKPQEGRALIKDFSGVVESGEMML